MILSYRALAKLPKQQTVSEFSSKQRALKITRRNIFFLLVHLREIGDLYEEEDHTILSNTLKAFDLHAVLHSLCKRRIQCTMVIFKQIFSSSTSYCFIRAQQPVEIGVSLCASRSDVPPLFSLPRFSLIVRDDIVLKIIKLSALYSFF